MAKITDPVLLVAAIKMTLADVSEGTKAATELVDLAAQAADTIGQMIRDYKHDVAQAVAAKTGEAPDSPRLAVLIEEKGDVQASHRTIIVGLTEHQADKLKGQMGLHEYIRVVNIVAPQPGWWYRGTGQ